MENYELVAEKQETNSFTKYTGFFVLLILLFSCATAAQAAIKYQATEKELNKIIQINNKLQALNQQLTESLDESHTELEAAQIKLGEYQTELESLTRKLTEVSAESAQLKKALQEAHELLKENNRKLADYEKKIQREIKSLKLQRNIAAAVAVLVLIFK